MKRLTPTRKSQLIETTRDMTVEDRALHLEEYGIPEDEFQLMVKRLDKYGYKALKVTNTGNIRKLERA
ncbi:hypothetical protein [Caudoviricetes sp.]|nr:hypothetical protein [Caudoviricetes sp.]